MHTIISYHALYHSCYTSHLHTVLRTYMRISSLHPSHSHAEYPLLSRVNPQRPLFRWPGSATNQTRRRPFCTNASTDNVVSICGNFRGKPRGSEGPSSDPAVASPGCWEGRGRVEAQNRRTEEIMLRNTYIHTGIDFALIQQTQPPRGDPSFCGRIAASRIAPQRPQRPQPTHASGLLLPSQEAPDSNRYTCHHIAFPVDLAIS